MDTITFEMAGRPPGPNARMHYHARARSNADWRAGAQRKAVDARNRSGLGGFPWARARVTYTFVSPVSRERDADNYIAACKPILDGVRDGKIVAGDDAGAVVLGTPVFERGAHVATRVTVERLDEGLGAGVARAGGPLALDPGRAERPPR